MMAQAVVKKPMAQMSEKPRVLTMKTPNLRKKVIWAPNRKQTAEHVVRPPEVTEIPT